MKKEREPSRKFPIKRFAAAVGLGSVDVIVGRVITGAAVAEASTIGFLKPMIENYPVATFGIVMGVGTAISIWSSIENTRLNREYGISPNLTATAIFNLLKKKWPSRTLFRDISSTAVQVVFTEDTLFALAPFVHEETLPAALAVKTGISIYNLTKIVGSEIILSKANKGKGTKNNAGERNLAPRGVVFAPAEVKVRDK